MPDAQMPDAARTLMATRILNRFTGASYRCEEVAAMDPVIFELIGALERGFGLGSANE